jgi:ferredoxin
VAIVKADRDICEGYGNCAFNAGDVFDLDDDGLVVVRRAEVAEEDRDRVEEAAHSCPVAALSVEDGGGDRG